MAKRLKSIDAQVSLYLQDLRGPQRRQFIRESATQLFGEARDMNRQALGYAPRETLSTDRVIDRPPEEMVEGGFSELAFELDVDIVQFALELLRRASPYRASNRKSADEHYRENHRALVDGRELAPPYELPPGWSRLTFVNLMPYARKIERGLSSQRPNGVYEALVLPALKERYGGLYNIRFAYEAGLVAPFGHKSVRGTRLHRDGRRTTRRRTVTEAARTRLPAIHVEAR